MKFSIIKIKQKMRRISIKKFIVLIACISVALASGACVSIDTTYREYDDVTSKLKLEKPETGRIEFLDQGFRYPIYKLRDLNGNALGGQLEHHFGTIYFTGSYGTTSNAYKNYQTFRMITPWFTIDNATFQHGFKNYDQIFYSYYEDGFKDYSQIGRANVLKSSYLKAKCRVKFNPFTVKKGIATDYYEGRNFDCFIKIVTTGTVENPSHSVLVDVDDWSGRTLFRVSCNDVLSQFKYGVTYQ